MKKTTAAFTDQRIKNWQRLLTSSATFQIESIRIIESDIFAPQTISLPRVLALIGLHGSGKTLLLRMLEAAFGYENSPMQIPPFFYDRDPHPQQVVAPFQVEGTVELTLRTPNGLISHVVDLAISPERRAEIWRNDLGDSYSVQYTGPLQAFENLVFVFQDHYIDANIVEIERSSRELTTDELNSIRNVLGRSYERLSVDTVDLEGYSREASIR